MIKNLKSKLIISLFLLVTFFSVTSSCFATPTSSTAFIDSDFPFSKEDLINSEAFQNYCLGTYGFEKYLSYGVEDFEFIVVSKDKSLYNIYIIFKVFPDDIYLKDYNSNGTTSIIMYDYSGNITNISNSCFYMRYDVSTSTFTAITSTGNSSSFTDIYNINAWSGFYLSDLTTIECRAFGLSYVPNFASVEVTHEFQSDTSAKVSFDYSSYGDTASVLKYSLTGVELNTDLTAPLQLRNPVTYTPRSNKFSC